MLARALQRRLAWPCASISTRCSTCCRICGTANDIRSANMTDDVVAIHESGHALMATVLGFELLRVTVGDGDPRYDLAPGPSRRLDRIRVLMGGGAAEEVVFDREPIGTGSDDQQIADLLEPDDDEIALRDEVRKF